MENIICSFCGKNKYEVEALVSSRDVHICNNCVTQANHIVTDELNFKSKLYNQNKNIEELNNDLTFLNKKPREIKTFLDSYVIGQEIAKKKLAIAVYNHYKRIQHFQIKDQEAIEIEKSNILIVGETGTGKTLLAKTIARFLNLPFTIVDATILTEAGYVGEDIESILSRLLQVADYDVKRAEKGIVFIDEIDKIARKGDNPSITRDVSGEGVQQGLLKLLEGSIVNVPPKGGRKHPDQSYVQINTKNILFIAGGAFVGIEKIIGNRLNSNIIGFIKNKKDIIDNDNYLSKINSLDLRKFGLIPELLGRFPVITYLEPLQKDTLIKILTEPKNAIIKQYEELFKLDNVKLIISPDLYEKIVDKTLKLGLGARGLRTIVEQIFEDYFYKVDDLDSELVISSID